LVIGPETNPQVGNSSSEIGGEAGHSSLPLVFVTIRVTTGEQSMDEAEQIGHLPAFDDSSNDTKIRPAASRPVKGLQKLNSARRRQGLSIRCVAQRLGRTVSEVRAQEDERADMLVSELYRWQAALEVPVEELLEEPEDALSTMVSVRAQLLKVMKTAMAMRRQARSEAERRLARLLTEQLLEIMPELKEVSGWPAVGHRRRADEVGRIGENPISEDWLHEAS
jgi:transcriptional regulator with XRE-family HTH domain